MRPEAWGWTSVRAWPAHVIPEQDLCPHRFGLDCPCRPTLERGPWRVVHQAWDAREEFEDAYVSQEVGEA